MGYYKVVIGTKTGKVAVSSMVGRAPSFAAACDTVHENYSMMLDMSEYEIISIEWLCDALAFDVVQQVVEDDQFTEGTPGSYDLSDDVDDPDMDSMTITTGFDEGVIEMENS